MESSWSANPISADSLVQEVVAHHPQAITILARYGLHCAGCYISPYHTLADSAREYALPLDALLRALNQAAAGGRL